MDPHGLLADWLRKTFPAGPPSPVNRLVPSFLLPNHEGWLVSSEDMRAQGPYVLAFFHGSWCHDCVARLKALDAGLDRIHELGADVLACSPETLEFPRRLKAENGVRFHVVSDVDCALAIDLGLAFPVSDETRRRLEAVGIDLGDRNGDPRWMLPTAVTMIVDGKGEVANIFVECDRPTGLDEIVAALSECSRKG